MESSDVSKFRKCVLDGAWDSADEVLMRLGFADEEALWVRISASERRFVLMLREECKVSH